MYLGPGFCSISLLLSMSTCMCAHTHTSIHVTTHTCTHVYLHAHSTLLRHPTLPGHHSLSICLHKFYSSTWSFYPSLENLRHILLLFKTHSSLGGEGSFPVPLVWAGPTFFKAFRAGLPPLQHDTRHLWHSSVTSPGTAFAS